MAKGYNNRMLQALLFAVVWLRSLAAIEPGASGAITSLCSNANCSTRYAFSLAVGASIKADARISVEFPLEFTAANLGVFICTGYKAVGTTHTAAPCSILDRTVTWEIGTLSAGPLELGLEGVKNPGFPCTTGYFKVWSYMSAYPIESNENFATVGISTEPVNFRFSSLLTTSAVINTLQTYTLKFTTSVAAPASSWIRVYFPSPFTIPSTITCSVSVLATAPVTCAPLETGSTWVNFASAAVDIPAATDVTISISGVKNQATVGYPGYIWAQLVLGGNYEVQQISSYLSAPYVGPGELKNIRVEGAPLNQGQETWYTVTATLTNPIPEGGYLRITFPQEFQGVTGCMADSGFVGATDAGIATCNTKKSYNSAWLTDFKAIASGSVSARVRAINPAVSASSAFSLQSMLPNGSFIDVSNSAVTLQFTSVSQQSFMKADIFTASVPRQRQMPGPLEFTLECSTLLPATPVKESLSPSVIGQILVTLPSTVEILDSEANNVRASIVNTVDPPAKLSCLFGVARDRAIRCDWDNVNSQITIDTPANLGLESCPLAITVGVIGYDGAGFNFPGLEPQTVKVQTYVKTQADASPVLKEEANLRVSIPAKLLSSPAGVAAAGSLTVKSAHSHVGQANYVSAAIKTSIDLPAGYGLEFEFNHFAASFGTEVAAGVTGAFTCFYDSAFGTFETCQIKVGDADNPTFIRLLNSGTAFAAGTEAKVYFPQAVNGATAGAIPSVTLRTLYKGGTVEYESVDLPALSTGALPATTVSLSPSSGPVQQVDFELTYTIPVSLAAEDFVMFIFSGYRSGLSPSTSAYTVKDCSGSDLAGYQLFSAYPLLTSVYTATETSPNPYTPCFKLPKTQYSEGSFDITILASHNSQIIALGTLTFTSEPVTMSAPTVEEVYFDTTAKLKNQKSLYKITFTTTCEVSIGGTISIMFPTASFSDVSTCFSLDAFPTDVTCAAKTDVTYDSATYKRVVIGGSESAIPPTANLIVHVAATSKDVATGDVRVFTSTDDSTIANLIEVSSPATITFDTTAVPTAEVSDFLTPRMSLRKNEFGPLEFSLKPTLALSASTSSSSYSCVKVSLPTKALPKIYDPAAAVTGLHFAPAAGGWLECKFNSLLASRCTIQSDVVTAYTPATWTVGANTAFTLTLSAKDATEPAEIGFKAPNQEGFYQFLVATYAGTVLKEEAATWVFIGAGRFTDVKVTSYNKGAGQFTALRFYFKAGTAMAASASGGVVYLEFPLNQGWAYDLGSDIKNNGVIDCPAGAGTVAATQFACTLIHSRVGAAKIQVSSFTAVTTGSVFDLTITGIKNPTAALTDLTVQISSYELDSTTVTNPFYKAVDLAVVTSFDTTFTVSPTTDSNSVNSITPLTLGDATATFKLTVPTIAVNDVLLVKLPTDFVLADSLTTCSCSGATLTCLVFKNTGWVLVSVAGSVGALTQLQIGPVTNPSYDLTVEAAFYQISSRKTTAARTLTFPTSLTVPATLVITNNFAKISRAAGYKERYCFKVSGATEIPMKGSLLISFPADYASAIDFKSCILGGETSEENNGLSISCVQVDTGVRVSHFSAAVAVGKFVEVCLDVTNPVAGTYQPFTFFTYKTEDSSYTLESGSDTTGITTVAGPTMASFTGETQYKPYVQVNYVSGGSSIAPLVLKLTPGTTITKNSGYVKITTSLNFSEGGAELRCVWSYDTNEYLGTTCERSGNTITMGAPLTVDIAGPCTLTITTTNALVSGLVWQESGQCTITVEVGSSSGTVYGYAQTVMIVNPDPLPRLVVERDHISAGYWNHFKLTFKATATGIPAWTAGGRLMVEFPSSFGNLGYSDNHSSVPCVTSVLAPAASSAIHCYYEAANLAINRFPAVIVSGFGAVGADTDNIVLGVKVKNGASAGDDQIVWAQLSVLDVSVGWPGAVKAIKRVDNLFALKAASPTSLVPAKLAIPADTKVTDAAVEFTFQVKRPGVDVLAGDLYYITFGDGKPLNTVGANTPTSGGTAATVFSDNSIIAVLSAGSADFSLKIPGFTCPGYQAVDMYYEGYHIQTGEVIATYKSDLDTSPILNPVEKVTIVSRRLAITDIIVGRNDGIAEFYQGDTLDWVFKVTYINKVPKNGAVLVKLSTSTFTESYCYAKDSVGTYTCTTSADTLTFIPTSDDQPDGITIVAQVKNSNSADTVTYTTKYDSSKSSGYLIETASVTISKESLIAPTFHEIPTQVHFPRSVKKAESSPFKFHLSVTTQLQADSGVVEVQLPGFSVAAGATLRCTWGLSPPKLAKTCSDSKPATTLIVTISTPAGTAIPLGDIDITISSINADDPEGQGLLFPADAQSYDIVVTAKAGGTDTTQTATEQVEAMNVPFASMAIDYGHLGHNQPNYFKFTFKSASALTGGSLRFEFPTKNENGSDLFAPDLGLEKACTSTVPCATVALGTPTCTLHCGLSHIDRPAYITVTGITNLDAATTEYSVSFDGIMNPAEAGTDDRIVSLRALSLDSTQKIVNSHTENFVFAVQTNPTPNTVITGGSLKFTGSPYNVAATLDLTLPTAAVTDTTSKLVLIFPFSVSSSDTIGTNCEVHGGSGWAIIRGVTSLASLKVTFASGNLAAIYVNASVKVYHIKAGVVNGIYDLACEKNTATAVNTGVPTAVPLYPSSAGKIFKSGVADILVKYTLVKKVPADGCIQVSIAKATELFCRPSYGAAADFFSDWSCTRTSGPPDVFTFKGSTDLASGGVIAFITRLSTADANIGAVTVKTFADSACAQPIEVDNGSVTAPIATETTASHPVAYFQPPEVVSRVTLKGQTANFSFLFTPRTALTAADSHHLELTAANAFALVSTKARPICFIDSTAAPCSLSGSTILIFPVQDLAADTQYKVELTSQGEDAGANGFVQPAAQDRQTITLKTYTSSDQSAPADVGEVHFAVPAATFSLLEVTPTHVSPDLMNIFKFKFTITSPLTSADFLIIEFPLFSEDNIGLFAADLGLSLASGSQVTPRLTGFSTDPTCFLKNGNAGLKVPPMFKCKGGVASATTVTVEVPAKNPDPADFDETILHFRVYIEDATQNVKEERWVRNAFVLDNTALTSSAAPTALWTGGSDPTAGAACSIDIAWTGSGSSLILVGSEIVLTATSFAASHKFTGANVLLVESPANSIALAGLTAPTLNPSVDAILVDSSGSRPTVSQQLLSSFTVVPTPGAVGGSSPTISPVVEPGALMITGAWSLIKLKFVSDTNVPASSTIEIKATSADTVFDEGFLQLPDIGAKTRWKCSASVFTVSNFNEIPSTANPYFTLYGKATATTSIGITVTVKSSSGTTWATASPTGTISDAETLLDTPTVNTNASIKVDAVIMGIDVIFTSITVLTDAANTGVYVNMPGMTCTGGVTASYTGGFSDSAATASISSNVLYASLPTGATLTAADYTLSYVLDTGCTPTSSGYYDIIVYTQQGTTKKDVGFTRKWFAPKDAPTAFTMQTYIGNKDSWTMVHATFQPSAQLEANDVLTFGFVVTGTSPFGASLGLGDSVSALPFSVTTEVIDECWLIQGYTGLSGLEMNAKIQCSVSDTIATSDTVDITFLKVKTPADLGEPKFEFLVTSAGTNTQYGTALNDSINDSACDADSSADYSLSPDTYDAATNLNFEFTLPNAASAADLVLVELGSGFTLDSVTVGGAVSAVIKSPAPCPCVIMSLSASASQSLSIPNVVIPITSAMSGFTVYPNLKTARKCANSTPFSSPYTSATLTAAAVTSSGTSTFSQNQDSWVSVSFTTPRAIKAGSSLVLKFPSATFQTAEVFYLDTSLTASPTISYSVSGEELTVTGFGTVASGATVNFDYLYVAVKDDAPGPTETVTITAKIDALEIANGTVSVNIATASYLNRSQFSSRLSALFGQDSTDLNGAATKALLRLHFKTSAAMAAKTEGVVVTVPSDTLTAGSSALFGVFSSGGNKAFAYSVTRSAGSPYTLTVKSPAVSGLATNTEYDLIIGANNADTDGLTFPDTGLVEMKISTTESTTTYTTNGLTIPGPIVFPEFSIQAFTHSAGEQKPIYIHVKVATPPTSAGGELVVQFPTDVFDANPFTISEIGGRIDCSVKEGGTVSTTAVCTGYVGDAASAYRSPAQVVVRKFGGSSDDLDLVISSVKVPANGKVADITVFSREVDSSDVVTLKGCMTYRSAIIARTGAPAALTQNWSDITRDSEVASATATLTISLSHASFDIDLVLVSFPAAYHADSFMSSCTVAGATVYPAPGAGLLLVLDSRVAKGPSSMSLVITNALNPDYAQAAEADAVITVHASMDRTATISSTEFKTAYAAAFTAGTVTVSSLTPSTVSAGVLKDFTVSFKFPNSAVPKDGVVEVTFPAGFQSLSSLAYVKVGTSKLKCTSTGLALSWSAPADGFAKDSEFQVFARVKTPATEQTTPDFAITAYKDAGKTKVMAETTSAGTVSISGLTAVSVPEQFYVPSQLHWQEVPVKAGEQGMLTFTFKSASDFAASGSVVLTPNDVAYFPLAAGTAVGVFYDMTTTPPHAYLAKTCSVSSGVWTVTPPAAKVIAKDTLWKLAIYSNNNPTSADLGPAFPDSAKLTYTWTVDLKYAAASQYTFSEKLANVIGKPAVFKVTPVVTHSGFANSFYEITIDSDIAVSTAGHLSLVFPLAGEGAVFEKHLGAAPGIDLGCDSDVLTDPLACKVVPTPYSYSERKYVQLDVFGNALQGTGTSVKLYFGGIKNPTTEGAIASLSFVVGGATSKVTAFAKMDNVFMVAAAADVTITHKDSFVIKLGTKALSTETSTTGFSLGVAVETNDYVVLEFPHDLADTSAVTTYGLTAPLAKRVVLCKATANIAASGSFDITGLKNPDYQMTPTLKAFVFRGGEQKYEVDFDTNPTAYDLLPITDVSIDPSTSYKNVLSSFKVSFKLADPDLVTDGGFRIEFPAGFTLANTCVVASWVSTASVDNTGQQSCSVAGSTVSIGFGKMQYTKDTSLSVMVWGTPGDSASSPMSFTVSSFIDEPTFSKKNGENTEGSLTLTASSSITLTTEPYLMTDAKSIARGDDYAVLSFSLKSATALTKNTGTLEITFESGLVIADASAVLKCLWINQSQVKYLAKTCSFTTGASDVLAVTAPRDTDIAASADWTVQALDSVVGLKMSSALAYGMHAVTAVMKGDGATAGETGRTSLFLAPKLATAAAMHTYTKSAEAPGNLILNFTPSTAIPVAEEATGLTQIVIKFETAVMGANLNNPKISLADYTDYIGETDCIGFLTFGADVKCYLRRGVTFTEIIVRKYAALNTSTSTLVIAPVYNPSPDKIVHVRLAALTYTTATQSYDYLQYQEFLYLYGTTAAPPTDPDEGAATYTPNNELGATATLALTFNASPALSVSNGGSIFLFLDEAVPTIAGVTIADHMIFLLPKNSGIWVVVTSLVSSPLSLLTVPLPPYAAAHTWTGYFSAGGVTVNKQLFKPTLSSYTISDPNIAVGLCETLPTSGPFTNRPNLFAVRIRPQVKIPAEGEIRVSIPAALGDADTYCDVQGGLTGAFTCEYAGSQVVRIYGFDLYDATVATLPAILLKLSTSTATSAASASQAFTIATYGTSGADELTTKIESGTKELTFAVTATTSTLTAQLLPLHQSQRPACLGEVATLSLSFTPNSVAYATNFVLKLQFFHEEDISAGSFLCYFADAVNTVPSESCTATFASSVLTMSTKVPEQISLSTGVSYTFSVQYLKAASSDPTGFTLPTQAQIDPTPYFGSALYYLTVYDTNGTSLKEAKKLAKPTCGPAFTALSLKLGTTKLLSSTFVDLSFQPAVAVAATDEIVIEFQTNNGIANVFADDLGVGAVKIGCGTAGGFTGATAPPKCSVLPATAPSPALVVVSTLTTSLDTATTHRVLAGKITTPAAGTDAVFSDPLLTRFRVYTRAHGSLGRNYTTNEGWVNFSTAYSTAATTSRDGSVALSGATSVGLDGQVLTYTLTGATTSLGVGSGYIVLDLSGAFILPDAVTCAGFGTTCKSIPLSGSPWVVNEVATGSAAVPTQVQVTLRTPEVQIDEGYIVGAEVFNGAGDWTETFSETLDSVPAKTGSITSVVSSNDDYKINIFDNYIITFSQQLVTTLKLTRITIQFPPEFQWINPTCEVTTNLKAASAGDPVSCVSDCSSLPCTKLVTITSFSVTAQADPITVVVGAMSPSTAGATGDFEVSLYATVSGTQRLYERAGGNSLTFVGVSLLFDAWIELPTVAQYDRQVKAGGAGDIYIRMEPKVDIPAGSGSVQVTLEAGFAPSAGSTPACTLRHGAVFYSMTEPWLSAECSWNADTRTVTVKFPAAILGKWNGFGKKCSLVVLSAVTADSSPGFTSPSTPGYYSAQVTSYDGGTKLESGTARLYLNPQALDQSAVDSTYTITSLTKTAGADNIFKVKFTTVADSPVGYLTFLKNIPQDVATIEVTFETYMSFAEDLGIGYTKGATVPCAAISGIVPKGQLQCTFSPGDLTLTTPLPARVLVNNFEALKAGTAVEIHLLKIKNPAIEDYARIVHVSMYKTSYDGTVSGIAFPTRPYAPLYATVKDSRTPVSGYASSLEISVSNTAVDATTTLTIPLRLSSSMTTGDVIYLMFPSPWVVLPATGLTVAINDNSGTPTVSSPVLQVYPTSASMTIAVPTATPAITLSSGVDYTIAISNFLNPAYMDSCGSCKVTYYTSVSNTLTDVYESPGDFWTTLRFKAGEVAGFSFTPSSYKVDAVNLKFEIKFSTVPRLPAGSNIQIVFPIEFPALANRVPPASCTTTLTATCSIYSYGVRLTGYAALKSGTAVSITITGGKNPALSSVIIGFLVSAANSSGQTIINHNISTAAAVTIVAADPVALYSFTLTPESPTAGITTKYVLKATAAAALPLGTIVTLQLPADFLISADLKCLELAGISSYRSCTLANGNSIALVLNENLNAASTFAVSLYSVTNPKTNSSTDSVRFGPISLKAVYDGTTLAQSLNTEKSSSISISPAPIYLHPVAFTLTPLNEAEIGLYIVSITAPVLMSSGGNYAVRLLFPKTYTRTLVPANSQLYCKAFPAVQKCFFVDPYEVRFEVFTADVPAQTLITLTVFGVANPPAGDTGQFTMHVVKESTVLSSADTAGSFRILAAPARARILNLTPDNLYVGESTTYNITFDTNVYTLVRNGAIFIDWPKQYQGLFVRSNYECKVAGQGFFSTNCTWSSDASYMRTEILVPMPTALNQQDAGVNQVFSIQLFGIPNPKSEGKTSPFSLKYLNRDTNLVVSSSFEALGNNTITFLAAFAPIAVPVVTVGITQGTYSDPIELDLGLSSYDPVRIKLSSDNNGIVFWPAELSMQYAWNTKASFRVGATANAKVGSFSVTFSKYERDKIKRFQPLSNLQVNVLKASNDLPVTIGKVLDAPVDVETLPVQVALGAMNVDTVVVALLTGQARNLTVTPSTLSFPPRTQFLNFTMRYTERAVSGSVYGQVQGRGAAPYQPLTNTAPFVVLATEVGPCDLVFANVSTIGRVSAQAEVRLSGKGTVWFMYQRRSARKVTSEQLKNQRALHTSQTFGKVVAADYYADGDNSYYKALIDMTELKDNGKYSLYFAFEGENKVLSDVQNLEFQTLPPYKPARFTIYTIVVMSADDVLEAVAKVLGVPKELLLFLGSLTATAPAGGNRLLQTDIPYDFVLMMDRGQEAASPQDQVKDLDAPSKKGLLQRYLPGLSPTPSIASSAQEYAFETPAFTTSPAIDTITNSTVTVSITQNVAGHIYGIVLERNATAPDSEQVTQCLDANNDPVPTEHCAIADTNGKAAAWLKFTGLEHFRRYRVWLAGTNYLPGFPALTPDEGVAVLNFTSGKLESTTTQEVVLYTWADTAATLGASLLALSLVL